jgi:hypothetical protein
MTSSMSMKGHLFFHVIPAELLRDVILCEMLEYNDIALLEVAMANHSIRGAKVGYYYDKYADTASLCSYVVMLHQLFYNLPLARRGSAVPREWMYLRCHSRALDIDTKDLAALDDYDGDISYGNCASYLQDAPDHLHKNILTLLHQIESNPHIASLSFDHAFKVCPSYCKLLVHISVHCPSVNKLQFSGILSINDIIAAMDMFPAVTSLVFRGKFEIRHSMASSPVQTYPNITALAVNGAFGCVVDAHIAALCQGFPNLSNINFDRCEASLLSSIFISCPRILSFCNTYHAAWNESDIISLLTVISRYGLNLKEFSLSGDRVDVVYLNNSALEAAVIKTINRLDRFQVFCDIRNSADVSIFTLPNVRAQIIYIDTSNKSIGNEVVIELMKKSKRLRYLTLRHNGRSPLNGMIPSYCSHLNQFKAYGVKITPDEMKNILVSSLLLKELHLAICLTETEVLENVALYGGNLDTLYIFNFERNPSISFASGSALWSDDSRKQTNRKQVMSHVYIQYPLDLTSAKLFLSWFGLIRYLHIDISPENFWPIWRSLTKPLFYDAIALSISFRHSPTSREAILLAIAEACRGITHLKLTVEKNGLPFNGDKIVVWAEKCSRCRSSRLKTITYSGSVSFRTEEIKIPGIKVKHSTGN